VLLAQRGQRVGVVDTDIQSPGIHVLFGLADREPPRTLNDFLWGRCPIADTALDVSSILQTGAARAPGAGASIYLVPSSLSAGEIARVLREGYDVRMLIDGYRALIRDLQLNYLLIDSHPGLNEETLVSLAISDVLVLILRPDRQDFQGTAVTVEVARQFDIPRMLLVMNKVLPVLDADALREQAEVAYGVPVAAILPESDEMLLLGSAEIFALRYPDHPWTAEVARIATRITEREVDPGAAVHGALPSARAEAT
jgi:MinD-like ATPase involved in chromosome partitioning or flagellar assembly